MKRTKMLLIIVILMIVIFLIFMTQNLYKTKQTSQIDVREGKTDTIWVDTLQLAWDKLKEKIGHDIELEGVSTEQTELVNKLNSNKFNEGILSSDRYTVVSDKITSELKTRLEKEMTTDTQLLNAINWNAKGDNYLIYTRLNKEMSFSSPFDRLETGNFNNEDARVKYFGINATSDKQLYDMVEVLLYNGNKEFAVSLNTVEGDKIVLYKASDIEKSLDDIWQGLTEKSSSFMKKSKNTKFSEVDTLKIPFINFDKTLKYKELEGTIKDSNGAIIQEVLQSIKFSLDDKGANVSSETKMNIVNKSMEARDFKYDTSFVIFLIEKEQPYFACKINDTSFLVKGE